LRFNSDSIIALTGAVMNAELDGVAVEFWKPIDVRAGQTLKLPRTTARGCRAYLAVRGGLDTPLYLGSRSTFTLGNFGGHAGRALRVGDVLHVGKVVAGFSPSPSASEAKTFGVAECHGLKPETT